MKPLVQLSPEEYRRGREGLLWFHDEGAEEWSCCGKAMVTLGGAQAAISYSDIPARVPWSKPNEAVLKLASASPDACAEADLVDLIYWGQRKTPWDAGEPETVLVDGQGNVLGPAGDMRLGYDPVMVHPRACAFNRVLIQDVLQAFVEAPRQSRSLSLAVIFERGGGSTLRIHGDGITAFVMSLRPGVVALGVPLPVKWTP